MHSLTPRTRPRHDAGSVPRGAGQASAVRPEVATRAFVQSLSDPLRHAERLHVGELADMAKRRGIQYRLPKHAVLSANSAFVPERVTYSLWEPKRAITVRTLGEFMHSHAWVSATVRNLIYLGSRVRPAEVGRSIVATGTLMSRSTEGEPPVRFYPALKACDGEWHLVASSVQPEQAVPGRLYLFWAIPED